LKVLDLFSGIGGFSLGLESAGMQTAAFCEYDQHARKVLQKHWPDVPIFHDIRDLNAEVLYDNGIQDIGLICGGYPCQPFSLAGQRRGTEDNRHLWPEMFRLIQELRPTWVIGENVVGHITMGLDQVLTDLEGEGYATRPFVIPACAVDAQHRRDRVWVIAHSDRDSESKLSTNEGQRRRKLVEDSISGSRRHSEGITRGKDYKAKRRQNPNPIAGSDQDVAYADSSQCQRNGSPLGIQSKYSESGGSSWWQPEPSVGRVADGVPNRSHRLRQLGNAVVPQVVEAIGQMIMSVEENK
jgi:DNA (cytosine-5)-methyltransferase 1